MSFLVGDKLTLSFNQDYVQLTNCQDSFGVSRNRAIRFTPDASNSLVSPRTYTSINEDIDTTGNGGYVYILFDCDIIMPYSTTPAMFTLTFTRNNSLYLVYTIQVVANTGPLSPVIFTADSY